MSFIQTTAIKGKIGDNDYYLAKMKANQLAGLVKVAAELEEWESLSIEEKYQRDPNMKRVKQEIAPYLACNKDRFYGSIIVVALNGGVDFESMQELRAEVPKAYQREIENIGFLTLSGGTYVVLDGQHRLLGLKQVVSGQEGGEGPEQQSVSQDDVSVILIEQKDEKTTRNIFTVVNRYAKSTTSGQNVAMDDKDAIAILSRRLVDNNLVVNEDRVNTKSSALPDGSLWFTTLIALYQMSQSILKSKTDFDQPNKSVKIDDSILEEYWQELKVNMEKIMNKVDAFKAANDLDNDVKMIRQNDHDYSLLMKPVAQEALVDALMHVTDLTALNLEDAIKRANTIPWSYNHDLWKEVLIMTDGKIQSGKTARRRAMALMTWLIAGDKLDEDTLSGMKATYQLAFFKKTPDNPEEWKDFPNRNSFV